MVLVGIMLFSGCFRVQSEMVVASEAEPTFSVSSGSGKAGEDVTVAVDIANNPGICTATVWVHYSEGLTLKSATDSKLLVGGLFSGDKKMNPFGMYWDDSANFDGDNNNNGTLATLVFSIDEDCANGDYAVWVTYKHGDIYNLDLEDFDFKCIPGKITVIGESCSHKYTNYTYNNDATYDADGTETAVCDYGCGETDTRIKPGTKLIHSEIADLKISGASLTLQDNLQINYKVKKSVLEKGYLDPYIIFEMNGVKTQISNYTVSGEYLVFAFSNISPDKMNDNISAVLYANYKGALVHSEARDYSIATYCYNMLSKCTSSEYENLRRMLVDLLNYGADSQVYNGYNTDSLVNANLSMEQKAMASEDSELLTVLNTEYRIIESPLVKWCGAGLNLKDSVTMRFVMETKDITGLSVKVVGAGKTWTIPSEHFEHQENDYYYVYFNGFDASQFSEDVFLTVYKDDKAVSNTIRYSIESYAFAKQNDSNVALANLVKSMMRYGKSAQNYKNQ